MIKRVQLIGHIKTAADLFLGFAREVTVNTTANALRVHDGATIGGFEVARADVANVPAAGVVDGKMTVSQAGDLSTAKTDITTLQSELDTAEAAVVVNAADIATNAGDITTNAGDIAINITDIAANAVDIATNAGNITANSSNIATAVINIDTNSTNISTNASAISTHNGSRTEHPVATTSLTGFMTGANLTKLNSIETAATADQTAAQILTAIKTVDGAGSGLDADLLDGLSQTAAASVNTIMRRDAAGRAKVVSPSASTDIATKGYVDSVQTTLRGELNAPTNTKALFVQNAAPTGWVKDTDQNNKALRIVSGVPSTGGATVFNSVFGSGKTAGPTTLTAAQSGLPVHNHTYDWNANLGAGSGGRNLTNTGSVGNVDNAGGAAAASSHNHTLSLDLAYIDIIKATKSA